MFLGEFEQNITEGARLALPKKIREKLDDPEVILSKGFEKCVFGYRLSDWEREAVKQLEVPISDTKTRNLKRYMFSGAAEISLDNQGRFVLPTSLREYASISDKVVVIGAGDHFEIWDENIWRENLRLLEADVLR